MTTNPFRAAIENGASPEQFAAFFTPDVTFHTPILAKTVRGRDLVLRMLATAGKVVDKLHYTQEMGDAHCTILPWNGVIDGYTLQAATVLVDDAAGLILHLTVLMRPWPVVTHVREAMHRELSSILPDEYWELDPQSMESRLADIIPAIAPSEPQQLTSGVTFHGAMLTKSVSGQAQVATILHEVHPILGPLTFLARFVTPTQSIELQEAIFKGYPMQGLTINQLDTQGAILDQTVMLRSWPVVALFRDAAQRLPLPFSTPDYWTLPEHPA